MENYRQNLLYVVNEYIYLACTFFLLGFSTYNNEADVRYEFGWSYIAVLGTILGFNLIIMILDITLSTRIVCKRKISQRNHNKKVKRNR